MKQFIILVALWWVTGVQAQSRCLGGGDHGGVPFSIIPEGVANNPNYVKTQSLLYDFIFWEGTNKLFYIDQWANYRTYSLADKKEQKFGVPAVEAPLSRVIDPDNRYVFIPAVSSLYDTRTDSLKKIPYGSIQKDVFWNDGTLYSYRTSDVQSGYGVEQIYMYDTNRNYLSTCTVNQNGTRFTPAAQSAFPYIEGFDYEKLPDGKYKVRRLRLDVRRPILSKYCKVEVQYTYEDHFPGKVRAMYNYRELTENKLNANIYLLDAPGKELLWDLGFNECTYYDLRGFNYSVLRSDAPVVALWNESDGLNVLYPRRTQRRFLPNIGQFGFTPRDFSLSKEGNQLFVSQRPEANAGDLKVLYHYDLEEIP